MSDWIEDPDALFVVLKLQAFRVGDEIVYLRGDGAKVQRRHGTVIALDWEDDKYNCPLRVRRGDGEFNWVHEASIKAWKPKTKVG